MSIQTHNEIPLAGCTPEPLMGYLKALGVFRLVVEQADKTCRAAWRNGKLHLRTTLSQEALVRFFYNDYVPTPVVVPWSGSDFFDVNQTMKSAKHKNTPTGSTIIEAFIQNESSRMENYRDTLKACIQGMELVGIRKKEQMKGVTKAGFLAYLRTLPYPQLDDWIDAASALPGEDLKLNTLLGSGGGSDGNTHFSDNFMQNLWDSLPDFDEQKAVPKTDQLELQTSESIERLRNSLFDSTTSALVKKRTSSLYNSGAVGGPNAGQGFERSSFGNPWDFILAIEGCVMFAGAVSRKLGASRNHAVFPFQTRATATNSDSLGDKETAGQEIWLPLWHRRCGIRELKSLLAEGRAEWRGKQSERAIDFAKSVASLGVDRGIDSFARYGIVKGRVGGDNYNTAAFLGRFEVKAQPNVDLLREADPWIDRYRRACGDKTPARFATALRRLDTTIFDYCRFGDDPRQKDKSCFQAILIALGQTEKELLKTSGMITDGTKRTSIKPLPKLSPDWVNAADDGSNEFAIAAALAGIQGVGGYPGIRANLEPVEFSKGRLDWKGDSAKVVWKRGSLADNLCAVLERRLLDAKRHGLPHLPIVSSRTVSPATVTRFISEELDEARIENLLWGLMCCKVEWQPCDNSVHEVPRLYALLKQCFPVLNLDGKRPVQVSNEYWEKAKQVKPEARIIQLVRTGRLDEALRIATQQLRSSGLTPAPIQWEGQECGINTSHLAAALLLPLKPSSLEHLWNLVRRYNRGEPTLKSKESHPTATSTK